MAKTREIKLFAQTLKLHMIQIANEGKDFRLEPGIGLIDKQVMNTVRPASSFTAVAAETDSSESRDIKK